MVTVARIPTRVENSVQGQPFRILFLSQRNSARSVMAEAIANAIGDGQIEAFSAGVRPAARIDPIAAELLQHAGLPVPDHPPQHVRIQRAGLAAARLRFHIA